jgi:hypothetical protein
MDKLIVIAIDVVLGLIVLGVALWLLGGVSNLIQAPSKLESALGDNAALVKGVEAQNKGTEALQKDGERRTAKSAAAVEAAGKPQLEAATKILATPAPGATPLERAANRINAEFGP